MLQDLREIFSPELLRESAKSLSSEIRDLLKVWVLELNAKSTLPGPSRKYPHWLKEGQVVRFQAFDMDFPTYGRILSVKAYLLPEANEEYFLYAELEYWYRFKNMEKQPVELLQTQVWNLEAIIEPVAGSLKKPKLKLVTGQKDVPTSLTLEEKTESPEQLGMTEELEERAIAQNQPEPIKASSPDLPSLTLEDFFIGCRIQHTGGSCGEFHALYGLEGIVVEHFGGDTVVNFSAKRSRIRCEISEIIEPF
ncbi:MAG: hypothetical protein KME46_33490 [Brasilonema angustatum HA4187-MV1]|nr:hypothetical protein [Brasilonema angustatum HA4187-MV1]